MHALHNEAIFCVGIRRDRLEGTHVPMFASMISISIRLRPSRPASVKDSPGCERLPHDHGQLYRLYPQDVKCMNPLRPNYGKKVEISSSGPVLYRSWSRSTGLADAHAWAAQDDARCSALAQLFALVGVTLAAAAASAFLHRHTPLLLSLSCLGGVGWCSMLNSCTADRPRGRYAFRRGCIS